MATVPITSASALLGRLFWMMVGPLCLAVLAIHLATRGTGWFTPVDLVYMAVLGGMIAARWLEFRAGLALTGTGEPATEAHLRRYALSAGALGLGVWVVANLASSLGLAR